MEDGARGLNYSPIGPKVAPFSVAPMAGRAWLQLVADASDDPRARSRIAMVLKAQDPLTDLAAYDGAFVTVRQLSEYWDVSRKHVLKLIGTGDLESIRLGPKTYRIPLHAAVAFERRHRSDGDVVARAHDRD